MPPGRPADAQHRRMRIILGSLAAHRATGLTRRELQESLGMRPDHEGDKRKFARDIATLRESGWHIDNLKVGDKHHYRLRIVDPRLRASFTEAERSQLLRAARAAGLGQVYDDLDPNETEGTPAPVASDLAVAQRAVELQALLHFEYAGRQRTVHPYDLELKPGGWRLRGLEDESGVVKVYAIERMVDLDLDRPGTAASAPSTLPPLNVDPMLRREHEPLHVELRHPVEHTDEVVALLGAGGHRSLAPAADGTARTAVTVTYLDAFVDRLLELERRVELVGPEEARAALRDRLVATFAVRSDAATVTALTDSAGAQLRSLADLPTEASA